MKPTSKFRVVPHVARWLVACAFIGLAGVVLLLVTRAAGSSVAREAESGLLGNGASVIANSAASGGSAVRFMSATGGAFVFPLKVSGNGRYLVDQADKPFFYAADTAWSMLEFLTVSDAKRYIDIRKSQGFSVIQTNLVWDMFSSQSHPRGNPFQGGDVTAPNEPYWAGVDEIMDYAQSQGMVLSAGLLWFSKHGGWEANGPSPSASAFAAYTSWVGNRYKSQGNLLWVVGGDDELSTNTDVKTAGAEALKAADPGHLITYHPRDKEYGLRTENWLGYNSFQWNSNSPPYTYEDVREGYDLSPTKPILDAEPGYYPTTCCGSDTNTTEQKNRRNGWWAVLAGGMGVTFGGGLESWGIGWNGTNWNQYTLAAPQHTGNIRKIADKFPWYKLASDWDSATVTSGRGSGFDYAIAGRADDGSLVMIYMPSSRSVSVNMSRLSGSVYARWFDPTTGMSVGAAQTFSNSGSQNFSPSGDNSTGESDWVLVLSTSPIN